MSLTQEIDLKPHAKTRVTFLTLAAPTRQEALEKLSHYHSGQSIYHAFDDAQARSEEELLDAGIDCQRRGSHRSAFYRPCSTRWGHCGRRRTSWHKTCRGSPIYGRSASRAITPFYWCASATVKARCCPKPCRPSCTGKSRHVPINLVILNDQDTGYALDLHNAILRQVRRMGAETWLNQREGIFVLRTDQLQHADQILFETVAGVILDEKGGTLAEHALRLTAQPTHLPEFNPAFLPDAQDLEPTAALPLPERPVDGKRSGRFQPGRPGIRHPS